ncbi:MAG: carbon starvation protein A [Oscillospiraceae bacterium]|nr:carbon starvation protein A [Oscillospiraceae bacterium]
MNLVLIFLAALAVLVLGYVFYGRFLEKSWGIDPARETPSQDCFDGKDYVPTPPTLVFGHHFASIASGLGMIGGALCASSFGWLPVLLWLLVGGIFFGAAQDFGALFVSLRTKGRSIGYMLRERVGERAQRLFSVLALIVLVLLVAVFVSLLAAVFGETNNVSLVGLGLGKEKLTPIVSFGLGEVSPTSSAATASILSVLVALLFGALAFRKNLPMIPVAIGSVLLLVGSVWLSFYVGINLPPIVWVGVIALYLLLASLTPVWALLQPRDFLCACLAGGVMLLGVVALVGAALGGKVQMTLPAIAEGAFRPGLLLLAPGGAIFGYHALIASGTTAKQLANEKHARRVSMGAMLLNTLLAVVALLMIGVTGALEKPVSLDGVLNLLASGMATAWNALFGGNGELVTSGLFYKLVVLALSVFALTTLDTCVRLARYLFAELFNPEGRRLKKLEGAQRFFATPAVGTLIVVVLGCVLGVLLGADRLWPLFGTANLLLAALALWSLSVFFKRSGKTVWALRIPAAVCLLAALYDEARQAFALTLKLRAGVTDPGDWVILALSLVLLVLAVLLLVQLLPRLWKKEQAQEAADDVD